jgi:hypothetical protein
MARGYYKINKDIQIKLNLLMREREREIIRVERIKSELETHIFNESFKLLITESSYSFLFPHKLQEKN